MNPFRFSLLVLFLCSFLAAQTVSPRARAIHDSAIIVDTHADTPQRFLYENFDIGTTDPKDIGHISLEKVRAGNLGAEFFSIWADPETTSGHFAKSTFDMIDSVYEQAARHPDRMMMAFSVDDIERAHKEKKLAALMGIEGGHSIENDIHLLRDFYRLGVRYMTLSWSNTNEWADSSGDTDKPEVEHHNGLTDFGKQVVLEMNRMGMMVDISHVADKTFYDAYNAFIDEDYRKAGEAQKKDTEAAVKAHVAEMKAAGKTVTYLDKDQIERQWAAKIPRPPLKSLIDHIDHIAKVAGIDHVGLGSDFDGVSGATPQGIDSAADLPKITQALLDRGYRAEDIRKILGGNLLRAFREVERVSREMQAESLRTSPGR